MVITISILSVLGVSEDRVRFCPDGRRLGLGASKVERKTT
jgi:hypothetical protein